jgi:hypothetical protein
MHTLPSVAFPTGRTPLVWAITCGDGHMDIVRYLLDQGANPENVDIKGFTPLHEAAKIGTILYYLLLSLGYYSCALHSRHYWMKRDKRDCNCGR